MCAAASARDREAFLGEMTVRHELAINFVRYNPRFRTLASIEPWARRNLRDHARDRSAYTLHGKGISRTPRPMITLWNAAQRQMVSSGWMHGYVRMYWAKKIPKWSRGRRTEAYDSCVRLNDRYELDGRDPNGYAGIAWAIGGKTTVRGAPNGPSTAQSGTCRSPARRASSTAELISNNGTRNAREGDLRQRRPIRVGVSSCLLGEPRPLRRRPQTSDFLPSRPSAPSSSGCRCARRWSSASAFRGRRLRLVRDGYDADASPD